MKLWFGNLSNFQPRSNLQFGAWCVFLVSDSCDSVGINHRLTLILAGFLSISSTLLAWPGGVPCIQISQDVFPQENITPVSEKSRLFLFLELLQEGLGQNKKLTTQLSKWQAVSPKNSMIVAGSLWNLPGFFVAPCKVPTMKTILPPQKKQWRRESIERGYVGSQEGKMPWEWNVGALKKSTTVFQGRHHSVFRFQWFVDSRDLEGVYYHLNSLITKKNKKNIEVHPPETNMEAWFLGHQGGKKGDVIFQSSIFRGKQLVSGKVPSRSST